MPFYAGFDTDIFPGPLQLACRLRLPRRDGVAAPANCVLMPATMQVDLSASKLKDPSAPSISRWQRHVTQSSP